MHYIIDSIELVFIIDNDLIPHWTRIIRINADVIKKAKS